VTLRLDPQRQRTAAKAALDAGGEVGA
jgi:hypothetical protein